MIVRFYRQFASFFVYFLISMVCFTLRPGPPPLAPKAPKPTPLAAPNFTDYDYPSSAVLDSTLFETGPTATTNWTALADNKTIGGNKTSTENISITANQIWSPEFFYVDKCIYLHQILPITTEAETFRVVFGAEWPTLTTTSAAC